MTHLIVTVKCGGSGPSLPYQLNVDPWIEYDNRENRVTPCEAYQSLLKIWGHTDVLVYLHDDVTVHDADWMDRIMACFDNPNCVAVGLGGALSLGRPDLYRKRYSVWNLARGEYASNATDAETHGERFNGVRRCAVLDAYCLAVRTEWLRRRGGWPVAHLSHHLLDGWLACEAARDGKEIFQVGASVTHWGGGTSTKPEYAKAKWLQEGSLEGDHEAPHRWLANAYRDVLPIVVSA